MNSTYNRQEVQECLIVNMAQVLSREEYAKFKSALEEMTDEDFWQFVAEGLATAPKGVGYKEQAKLVNQIRSINGITPKNSAMNDVKLQVVSEEMSRQVWNRIIASRPSDVIKLTGDEDSRLIHLWEKSTENVSIPSDLFFAGTIPLLDCRIVIDETECCSNGKVVSYRVVIFSDYAERLRLAEIDEPVTVGAIVNDPINGAYSFIPFHVVKGVDSILFSGMAYHGLPEKYIQQAKETVTMQQVTQMAIAFLETWYGIQIALLHPTMREVFRHPRTAPDTTDVPTRTGKRKNRVKYIKVHVINSDEMNAAMYGESKTFTRHALVWYVIGHWRNFADGRKVFVKPFWKGPLRELKEKIEMREREIVQATGGVCNAG